MIGSDAQPLVSDGQASAIFDRSVANGNRAAIGAIAEGVGDEIRDSAVQFPLKARHGQVRVHLQDEAMGGIERF